jgi:hypothetical protein
MTFLTINAHNRMLDVTCHRNLISLPDNALPLLSDRIEREREREKGGLKLLYQLMEKYTNISVAKI